jgi:hypothetical protein
MTEDPFRFYFYSFFLSDFAIHGLLREYQDISYGRSGPVSPLLQGQLRALFVRTVPVFILLMTGEAVQYRDSIFTDFVDNSRLFCNVFNMTGNAMFHMFAGWSELYFQEDA